MVDVSDMHSVGSPSRPSFSIKVGKALAHPQMLTSIFGLGAVGLGAYYGVLGISLGALLPQAAIIGGVGFAVSFAARKIFGSQVIEFHRVIALQNRVIALQNIKLAGYQMVFYSICATFAVGLGLLPVTAAAVGVMNYMYLMKGVETCTRVMILLSYSFFTNSGRGDDPDLQGYWWSGLLYYALQASNFLDISQYAMQLSAEFSLPSYDPLTNITLLLMVNVFQGALMALQYAAGYGDDYGLSEADRDRRTVEDSSDHGLSYHGQENDERVVVVAATAGSSNPGGDSTHIRPPNR